MYTTHLEELRGAAVGGRASQARLTMAPQGAPLLHGGRGPGWMCRWALMQPSRTGPSGPAAQPPPDASRALLPIIRHRPCWEHGTGTAREPCVPSEPQFGHPRCTPYCSTGFVGAGPAPQQCGMGEMRPGPGQPEEGAELRVTEVSSWFPSPYP